MTDVATLIVVMGPDFSNNVARMTHALNARLLVLCKLPGYCHGRFSGNSLVTSLRLSGAGLLPDCPSLLPVCFPTSLPGLGNVLGNATKGSWYAQNTGRYVSELFGQVKYSALKK